jgi:hypothetical protein
MLVHRLTAVCMCAHTSLLRGPPHIFSLVAPRLTCMQLGILDRQLTCSCLGVVHGLVLPHWEHAGTDCTCWSGPQQHVTQEHITQHTAHGFLGTHGDGLHLLVSSAAAQQYAGDKCACKRGIVGSHWKAVGTTARTSTAAQQHSSGH